MTPEDGMERQPRSTDEDAMPTPSPRAVLAEWLYWFRRHRPEWEDARLFGEPAWDMALDLYAREARGLRTSVSDACIASYAPATTALRYVDLLCEIGWVEKVPDESDRRRSHLAMTRATRERMDAHLDRLLERLRELAPSLLPLPAGGG